MSTHENKQNKSLDPMTELAATMLRIQHAYELSALRAIDKAVSFLRDGGLFMIGSSFIRVPSLSQRDTVYTTCLNECTCPAWTERAPYWEKGEIDYPFCWHWALFRIVLIEKAVEACRTPDPPTPQESGNVARSPFIILLTERRPYTQADYDELTA